MFDVRVHQNHLGTSSNTDCWVPPDVGKYAPNIARVISIVYLKFKSTWMPCYLFGNPTPRVSETAGLGWDLIICTSGNFLGEDDVAGLRATL